MKNFTTSFYGYTQATTAKQDGSTVTITDMFKIKPLGI
jgi:hypothetical protein